MASTAAPSAPFLSPRPIHRDAASAAASVTRTSSRARLRSGTCLSGHGGESSSGDTGAMTARDDWRKAFDASPTRDADFETMSGHPVEPVYGPDDGEFPGPVPVHPRAVRVDVPVEALDDADVRRLRHARRHEPPLPRDPRGGRRRPVDRVRPADADGPRLRRPRERGRSRQVRRRRRHARRHGRPLRRHRPRRRSRRR